MLAKSPGFTLVTVLTLALGIGANTTIFSWIHATLLTPVPGVEDTAGMVSFVRGDRDDNPSPPLSYLDYKDLRERNQSFSGLIGYHDDWMALTGAGQPERIYGTMATANYFQGLGLKLFLGRDFFPQEETASGGAPVVILSHRLWQTRFQEDRAVLGKTMEINRHRYTIIGVTPPLFQGAKPGLRSELWVPVSMDKFVWGNEQLRARDNCWLNVLGRLRPGADRQQAQLEMNHLMKQIADQFPTEHRDSIRLHLDPLWCSPIGANRILFQSFSMLMAVAGVVLLLACANVANLMLVRSVGRRREIAIRFSMGCSRGQLIRQLLAENLLIALLAGLAALLVNCWTSGLLAFFVPPINLPISFPVGLDQSALWMTLAFSLLAAALFGILPALRTSRLAPAAVLKEEAGTLSGGLHKSRLARMLVISQISLSMLLLISAGLFLRSMLHIQAHHPGFDKDQVALISFDLLPAGYSREEGREFFRQLPARLQALPGIKAAALADSVPLSFMNHTSVVQAEGYQARLHESMEMDRSYVGANYLATLHIPLVSGRDFTVLDTKGAQEVVIVNQAFANRFWPGQDAIGKRIQAEGRWWVVVGVTRNFQWTSLEESPRPFLFMPLLQNFYPQVTLYVRVSGEAFSFFPALEKAIHEMKPDLPLYDETTLSDRVQVAAFPGRIAYITVGILGILSLFLAAVGIFGVLSYTTGQRIREVGIRMALGAKKSNILGLVLCQGSRWIMTGVALGGMLSLALTRFLHHQLFGVTPTDALTFSAVTVLLAFVGLLATFIPAYRAAQVNPIQALRCQ
jgi:predicted permease